MSSGRGHHLAPSPNWYCPCISDCNSNGLFAYGARHEVVILRTNVDPPVYEQIQSVHSDRVTTVAFSKTSAKVLASGSEDCFVKIWNVVESENGLLLSEDKEHKFDQKIGCVAWQHENRTVFVTEGQLNIWMWDINTETVKPLKTGIRNQPIVLQSCPYTANQLAVGYKGGILAIIDVSKKGAVLMKLKGHDDDILSLSWNPNRTIQSEESLDLVSTSRDRTLRVWNLDKERYIHFVKIPQVQGHGKNLTDANNKNRLWMTSLWSTVNSNVVFCTTVSGDVMQVELSADKKPVCTPLDTNQGGSHNRCIFNLSISGNILCSVSLDRQIVLYDVKCLKSIYALSTLGGFAQCMTFSPIDHGRLAVGCGDKTVRIWRTSSTSTPYLCTMLWQGINGKVTTLAWHPTKENQLAFGTDEGHVGILDASGNKPPVIFKTYHRCTVYTVCWAPFRKSSETDKYYLYSCGDGNVLIHDQSQHEKEAKNLNDFLNPKVKSKITEIAWKQDYTFFAVGCEDGTVEVFSAGSELIVSLKAQSHLIQCLRWHPISTSLNPTSNYQHYLASSSYDTVIHVYDLTDHLNGGNDTTKVLKQSSLQLVGHTSRINSLSWNPHIDGQLASASYDGSVQLWNALNMDPIGNYRGHLGLVFCVQWSETNPEAIFSGGDDLSVRQFSTLSLLHKLPPPKKNKKSKKSGAKNEEGNSITESVDGKAETVMCNGEVNDVPEQPKTNSTPASSSSSAAKKKRKKQPASQKSGFPICNSLDARGKEGTLEDIRNICSKMKHVSDTNVCSVLTVVDVSEAPNLGFFLKCLDFKKTQTKEENGHRESGNTDLLFQSSLWKGDIEQVLREAADLGQLNDYLVSLAPLGSRILWLEMCHKYALQLQKEENYAKAANYFLACHKIYEGVEMLISQHCFREALAIAKGRFPQSDPILTRIYHEWASKAEKDGNFELVAKCHLALGEHDRAAKCLARRNDAQSHAVAAFIAAENGVVADTEDYIISCIHQALTRNEWEVAKDMLEEQIAHGLVSNLHPLLVVVTVHELLTNSLKVAQEQSKKSTNLQDILECKLDNIVIWKGQPVENGKQFLQLVEDKIKPDLDTLSPTSLSLLDRLGGQRSLSSREIIYETAVELSHHMMVNEELPLMHLSKMLGINFSAEPEYTILNVLCALLFPFELRIPQDFRAGNRRSSIKAELYLEDLVKNSFNRSEPKTRECNSESSVLGFFVANLLDCLTQEASRLPKSTFLKHQGECDNCKTVVQNITMILDSVSTLSKQSDFVQFETLSAKIRKLDENIARVCAATKQTADEASKLQELRSQKSDVTKKLESLPEEAKILAYPKNAVVNSKARELCKQLALSIHCSKTSAKVKALAEKF